MAGQAAPRKPPAVSDELGKLSHSSSQRGLDLNAPLLSVRRHTSSALRPTKFVNDSYQLYKQDSEAHSRKTSSDVTLESLRSPGTVPFLWEQSPGRPKSNGNTLSSAVQSFTPCLPPCRASPLHVAAGPGRASPTRNVKNEYPISINGRSGKPAADFPLPLYPRKADCQLPLYPRKAAVEEKPPSFGHLLQRSESCASNTSDGDVFSDAAETFAHTEAPTDTDRTSCLGGRDSAGVPAGHTDPRARDFIMRRFLPAAQAMVSESPASLLPDKCVLRKAQQPVLPGKTPSRPVAYRMLQQRLISAEDDNDDEDAENASVFSSKACSIFGNFRLGAIRHLLPQSSAGRVKSKEKSHSVKSSRRKSKIDLSEFQSERCVTSTDEEFLQGSNSDEEDYLRDVKERHESQSQTDRSKLTRTLIETKSVFDQLPSRAAYPKKNARDSIQAEQNRLYHSYKHEAKGFLGIPHDKIVEHEPGSAIKRRQSSLMTSVTTELERITLVQTHGLVEKHRSSNNVIFSLELNFTEPGVASSPDMGVTEGQCLKNCKRNQSASCNHRAIDSKDIISDAVEQSIVNPVEKGWPLGMTNYACLSTGMDNKLSEAQEQLPATRPKVTAKGRDKKVHWQEENLITPKPVRPSLPPLPKSPSQPWQWRSVLAPSPSSSPLVAYTPPQNMYAKLQPATNSRMDVTASWEELVKSASVQTGHLRYSNVKRSVSLS
ncbi:hypothetical protein O6H91_13G000800 [Diphasiastrum complanatum]|uniref:Uncharacterized protein n=1 Tax=Diphasiastrum complanatum TaxID=34168 RepID=A0ACC2BRN8_DIPCM|nr:hypothetical protein O6H91_13G000800 [Diphasiastrum complanatum]